MRRLFATMCLGVSTAWFTGGGCAAPIDEEFDPEEPEEIALAAGGGVPCADPGVMRHGSLYYLTCTGGGAGGKFPIYESADLHTWTHKGYVFSGASHPWGKGKFWAPELHHSANGVVAYYSALDDNGRLSIGAAHAPSPLGPYQDLGQPLVARGFSVIDAHVLRDGNKMILYYKRNDNGDNTTIFAQELDGAGLTKVGSPKGVLNFSQAWEGKLIEAPWVVRRGEYYYLFYTGDLWCNHTYSVGVARSKSPFGPFTKHAGPILDSGSRWRGPGHTALVRDAENVDWLFYHAYDGDIKEPSCKSSGSNPPRMLRRGALSWKNGWPAVTPPKRECSLRCCDGTLAKVGSETRNACRDAWTACKSHGFSKRIRWGEHVIYEKQDPACGG